MKKETKVWALTLLAFWWLSPNSTYAQQQDSVRTLDEITISGTRVEQPVLVVPRSVSVITSDIIQRSVHNSVADLLSREAGLYIVGTSQTPGTNQSVFMRGTNSNQVVVLVDGMRITDPSSPNGTIDLSEISLTDVERIEIVRGGHSTLYGGAAIGGAINIITKKGGPAGFHGNGSVQAGTFGDGSFSGTGSVNLNYNLKNGFYFNGSVFRQNVDGLNATEDTIRTATYKTTDKDGFEKTDLYLKAGYTAGAWDVFVAGKRSDQRADVDDRAYDDDDNAYLDFNRSLLEYSATYSFDKAWKISLAGSAAKSGRYAQNDSSLVNTNGDFDKTFSDQTYNGRISTAELQLNYSAETFQVIFGGGNYREKMAFQTFYFSNAFGFPFESEVDYDTINSSVNTSYVFGHLSVDIGNFNVKAGSRFNNHSLSGNFFTADLSPSFKLDNTLVYASVSSAYNAPSLYQLYDPTTGSDPAITRGNPNLEAEQSLSLEIGVKKEFNNGSHFTISAYSTAIRNDIEYVYLWNEETPIAELSYLDYVGDKYLNISKQTVRGIEVSGRWNLGKFYSQGNVSWMDGKITVDPEDIAIGETGGNHVQLFNYGSFVENDVSVDYLARRPMVMAYAEAGYTVLPSLTAFVAYRHTGSRNDVEYNADLGPFGALSPKNVAGYNLFDIGLSYRLNKFLSFQAKMENVMDEEYREIQGYQTRGRSGYMKITFSW